MKQLKELTHGTKNTLNHWQSFKFKLVLEGMLVGLVVGFIIVLYRLTLDYAFKFLHYVQELVHANPIYLIPWFGVLICVALILSYMIRKEPLIKGSGIPQVEGFLLRKLELNGMRVLIYKFIGGVLALGTGLSLGREGPSIQIGASVGKIFSGFFKRNKLEEKFLVTDGASAGLAAAFNAPLSGVMFSLEELHKNFSPIVMVSALAASITADFVSKTFFGLKPVFDFSGIDPLPLHYYPLVIILGIIMGAFGAFYNKILLRSMKYYRKKSLIPKRYKKFIPVAFAGIFLFIFPEVLGGGHHLIEEMIEMDFSLKFLLALLAIKFIYSMICYGSGVPGGIFLPLLVIGAITGELYGSVLSNYLGMDPVFVSNMIILAMAGNFSAIVRAPITGIVLICEMAGTLDHLLALATISIVAYVVADMLKSHPIYESLLHRIERNKRMGFRCDGDTKVLIETVVCLGSVCEGKMIKQVEWPEKGLIVGIRRGNKELIPKGETILQTGDYLIMLTDEDLAAEITGEMSKIAEEVNEEA